MRNKFDKSLIVPISLCDHTASISVPSVFSVFMDLAAEHAEELGIGAVDMANSGRFWLTVRTKVHINEKPAMLRNVSASTWPVAPGGVRCMRYYTICDGNKILACGKTEWAVVEIESGKLCKTADVYPSGLELSAETVCDEPFAKIKEDFSGDKFIGTYIVRSTDIDLGRHMNNAAYVKALFGMISCKELEDRPVKDVEAVYRTPCFEGDELAFYRRDSENAAEYGVFRQGNPKPAFLARIEY